MSVYAPPIPPDQPFYKMLHQMWKDITGSPNESNTARFVVSVTPTERQAIEVLASVRGWTSSYAVRRGIHLVIEEAIQHRPP